MSNTVTVDFCNWLSIGETTNIESSKFVSRLENYDNSLFKQ